MVTFLIEALLDIALACSQHRRVVFWGLIAFVVIGSIAVVANLLQPG
jgi:hypothetical protein